MMTRRLPGTLLFIGLLPAIAIAGSGPSLPFTDGLWSGGIETGADSRDFKECRASTTFGDGTTLTLAKQDTGRWSLRLSNPDWQLPPSQSYDMNVRVDFYPRLQVVARASDRTGLEIADLDQISLLGLIENGHVIDLTAEGFAEEYDLEGSAKVIDRIRNCFAARAEGE